MFTPERDPRRLSWVHEEEDPREFPRIHQAAQLHEAEEWNEGDGDDDRDEDRAEDSAAPERLDAVGDGLPMQNANHHFLDDIENDENDSEQD